ncbi:MAG: hypothetical protein AAF447_22255 [Myxococcota bacterium]
MTNQNEHDDEPVEAAGEPPAHHRDAKDELAEAFGHFKAAATKLMDRAKDEPALKASRSAMDEAIAKLDPALRSVSKGADDLVDRIDPALEGATREAERLIQKIGQGAEPLARQLGEELGKLGQLFSGRRPQDRGTDDEG